MELKEKYLEEEEIEDLEISQKSVIEYSKIDDDLKEKN